MTATPASRKVLAVPPVDRISVPRAANPLAMSTIPVLSETLINARFTPAIACSPLLRELTIRPLKSGARITDTFPKFQGAGRHCKAGFGISVEDFREMANDYLLHALDQAAGTLTEQLR